MRVVGDAAQEPETMWYLAYSCLAGKRIYSGFETPEAAYAFLAARLRELLIENEISIPEYGDYSVVCMFEPQLSWEPIHRTGTMKSRPRLGD